MRDVRCWDHSRLQTGAPHSLVGRHCHRNSGCQVLLRPGDHRRWRATLLRWGSGKALLKDTVMETRLSSSGWAIILRCYLRSPPSTLSEGCDWPKNLLAVPLGAGCCKELWEAGPPMSLFWTSFFSRLPVWGGHSYYSSELCCSLSSAPISWLQ